MPTRSNAAGIVLLALLLGCGGASSEGSTTPPRDTVPTLELTIRDPRTGFVHVGDLRGQVVIVVVITTFDTMSHALLSDLQQFTREHEDVAFVGVLMQPGAETLADAFVLALDPSFAMGFDPDERIAGGTTALGTITTVPAIFALDRAGHVVSRREGYQSTRVLEAMLLDAGARVPAEAVTQPPLMGETPPPR